MSNINKQGIWVVPNIVENKGLNEEEAIKEVTTLSYVASLDDYFLSSSVIVKQSDDLLSCVEIIEY
jgi:hypothetical protein